MITVNDLIRDFNPTAKLVIANGCEDGEEIVDISWNDNCDRKPSLENTKRSKMETDKIYLCPKETEQPIESKLIVSNNSLDASQLNNTYLTIKSGGWVNGNFVVNTADYPYVDSDKCILSTKFRVKRIIKNCALVKDLDINVGNIININMNVISSTKRGRCRAHYVDVYNVGNGMRKEYSLNTIANMINKSLEIYRYQ